VFGKKAENTIKVVTEIKGSRDSSIAWFWATDWMIGVSSPDRR
jgi:hypothetical protein